ncbi:HNH endonuclease [Agrobacterium vitis]
MRRLNRPPFAARDALNLCIKSIRDKSFTERLAVIQEEVEVAETSYMHYGNKQMLFQIPIAPGIGEVTATEMKRVYKDTFAKSTRTRDIYDTIKKQPVNDICPICGQRTVGSLDHYLAQSLHPALVISPINLVPACIDCNKAKLDAQPETAEQQTLHPYFDNVDDGTWLYAAVEETKPASLRFYPDPPIYWPTVKRQRVIHHFRTFGLGALYASHSGVELTNIRYSLQRIAERGTVDDIRAEILDRAESARAAHINSWQTSMYHALAESDWFCAGGFD